MVRRGPEFGSMAFVRTGLLIVALVMSWVALRVEGSAHVATPSPASSAPATGGDAG